VALEQRNAERVIQGIIVLMRLLSVPIRDDRSMYRQQRRRHLETLEQTDARRI